MDQEWKCIEFGVDRYSILNDGKVRNNITGLILSTSIQNSGYEIVGLNVNGKSKKFTIHRLVAMAFINKIDGKNLVDHKDSNKLNNHYTNLRWVDSFENMRYAVQSGCMINVIKKSTVRMKRIGTSYGFDNSQKNLKTAVPVNLFFDGKINSFRSTRQAAKVLNIYHKTLTERIKRGMYKIPV